MKELYKKVEIRSTRKNTRSPIWEEYEQSLCNRGSLTLWISPSVIKSWKSSCSLKILSQPHITSATKQIPVQRIPSIPLTSIVLFSPLPVEHGQDRFAIDVSDW